MNLLRIEEVYQGDSHEIDDGEDDVALVVDVCDHGRGDLHYEECPEPLADDGEEFGRINPHV